MVTATDRRPVRVTLEGEAYRPHGADSVLMVVLASGHKVCLTEGLGVTVEDVAPPRVWTDGDVVQHPRGNYVAQRRHGEWRTTTMPPDQSWPDSKVNEAVAAAGLLVLRYQAGESA